MNSGVPVGEGHGAPASPTSKVLVIVPFPMSSDDVASRAAQRDSVRLDPGVELTYVPVRVAPGSYDSYADYALADVGIVDAGLDAQRLGYDAVCVDTMSDSGVAALRSLLEIPVVGTARAAYCLALGLGERFGVLAMWSAWFPMYKKILAEQGLTDRCVTMRAPEIQPDNRKLLAGREAEVLPHLLEAAKACVDEDGADVIVLGSTTMHAAHAYLRAHLEVPVVNPGPASYRFAQMSMELGLAHSRRAYRGPRQSPAETIRLMADAVGRRDP